MQKKSLQSHKGFTLMEVMVAVSIFAIVVTIGIGALLTINNNYRNAQVSRQAVDSLTYILESMSRSLRTARTWDTANSSTTYFSYWDQDNAPVSYDLVGGTIVMNASIGGQPATDHLLTPNNVVIDNLTFTSFTPVLGQKYLQINIAGTITQGNQSSRFAFQTSVSKRTGEQ